MRFAVRSLVVAWFLVVLLLGRTANFISPAGTPTFHLATDERFIRNPLLLAWNLFGIAYFVVAVAMGTIDQGVLPGFQPTVVSSLMQPLPFVLVPWFFVPWLLITHITMLMQRRRA